eukprot:3977799-Prymnesium_polylepis.1
MEAASTQADCAGFVQKERSWSHNTGPFAPSTLLHRKVMQHRGVHVAKHDVGMMWRYQRVVMTLTLRCGPCTCDCSGVTDAARRHVGWHKRKEESSRRRWRSTARLDRSTGRRRELCPVSTAHTLVDGVARDRAQLGGQTMSKISSMLPDSFLPIRKRFQRPRFAPDSFPRNFVVSAAISHQHKTGDDRSRRTQIGARGL